MPAGSTSERAKSSCGNSPFMGTFHETWSLGTFQAGRTAEQMCEVATSAHPGFLEATGLIQTHPPPVPQLRWLLPYPGGPTAPRRPGFLLLRPQRQLCDPGGAFPLGVAASALTRGLTIPFICAQSWGTNRSGQQRATPILPTVVTPAWHGPCHMDGGQ